MHKSLKYLIPAFMVFTLAACGGSSSSSDGPEYSGKKEPANFSSIPETQKKELAVETSNVVIEAMEGTEVDPSVFMSPLGVTQSSNQKGVIDKANDVSVLVIQEQRQLQLPLGVTASEELEDVCDSGTIKMSGSGNEEKGSGSIVYSKCKLSSGGDSIEVNGATTYSFSPNSFKLEYKNFHMSFIESGVTTTSKINGYYKVDGVGLFDYGSGSESYKVKWNITGSFDGQTTSSSGEISCVNGSCTAAANVKSDDGKTYRVEDLVVSENSYPKVVSGKVYHPDHGSYQVEVSIEETCDDEVDLSPFIGTAKIKDDAGNTINYSSEVCEKEPNIT